LKNSAQAGLLSDEPFTPDGTMIEALAFMKNFFAPRTTRRPRLAAPVATQEVDFHGDGV
jgi:hypothetical protein